MSQKRPTMLPQQKRILAKVGENMKLARLRRKLSMEQVAERADISRTTLWHIEEGSPSVAMGYYLQVLSILGLEDDLLAVASDDKLGRKLQDAELKVNKRAPKSGA
ncbi:MAG: helix-turn-helix transcriptional regulator [Balneolaceae bacterium]|nr:helix-turn-helix transcriptional regulator [Balneolaceae bacterium]